MRKTILASMLFAASGCAYTAPGQPSRAALGKEGVQVALVGQYCGQDTGPDWMSSGPSEIALKLEISNHTPDEVQIHRDKMQLRLPEARTAEENAWQARRPIRLASGTKAMTSIEFLAPPSQSCTGDLQLDLQGAITAGDKPIPVAPIRFIAQSP